MPLGISLATLTQVLEADVLNLVDKVMNELCNPSRAPILTLP